MNSCLHLSTWCNHLKEYILPIIYFLILMSISPMFSCIEQLLVWLNNNRFLKTSWVTSIKELVVLMCFVLLSTSVNLQSYPAAYAIQKWRPLDGFNSCAWQVVQTLEDHTILDSESRIFRVEFQHPKGKIKKVKWKELHCQHIKFLNCRFVDLLSLSIYKISIIKINNKATFCTVK